jgi:hypothetical protein
MRAPAFAATTLLCLLLLSCSDSDSDGFSPREGYWQGDHLVFQVDQGAVILPGAMKVSCNGDSGCFAEGVGFFPDVEMPIAAYGFGGVLEAPQGSVEITGLFESATYASGTYRFTASAGCCSIAGSWRAEFVKSYEEPEPGEDVTEDSGLPGEAGPLGEERGEPPPLYPPSASPEQVAAIMHVNELRQILDLPLIAETEPINKAAQAHAAYFESHCSQYLMNPVSPHEEKTTWPEGFSGVTFFDRMVHFGFSGIPGWEVMAFVGEPTRAVDSWLETLYHRIPFVHPNAYELGYGMVKGGCYRWSQGTDVMDFSRVQSVAVDHAVAYPYDGQTEVNPSWDGSESPQPPMPAPYSYPSGPIITLTFPNDANPKISGHELLGPGDSLVSHMYVDAGSDPYGFLQGTVSIYAYDPLKEFTQYKVRFAGSWKGLDQTWEWSFTTGAMPPSW